MLALFNLSTGELVIIAVVAVLVFGRRLPEVAGQAAGMVQRMRRSLEDLRRDTGIDREIQNARRTMDEAVPRDLRRGDLRRAARERMSQALGVAEVRPEEEIPGGLAKPSGGPAPAAGSAAPPDPTEAPAPPSSPAPPSTPAPKPE